MLTDWKLNDIISLALRNTVSWETQVNMQRYRSGHNEAVLKTVCPKGHVGSNPTLCVNERWLHKQSSFLYDVGVVYLFDILRRSTQEAEGAPLERE